MTDKVVTVYLAHPRGARDGVRIWEERFEEEHPNIRLMNPFYDYEYNIGIMDKFDKGGMTDFDIPLKVVNSEIDSIIECDMFLGIIITGVRVGTYMEIVYANTNDKPIILVVKNGLHNHPWLRYHADTILTDYDKVADEIMQIWRDM